MGLHTNYLGRLNVTPFLSAQEVDYLRAFRNTWSSEDRDRWDTWEHPSDGDLPGQHHLLQAPGNRCPWAPCDAGCCLHWDGHEKPSGDEQWLRTLIRDFLKPRASAARDRTGRFEGFTFNHVLDGVLVGERQEHRELFALVVKNNRVTRKTLMVGVSDSEVWGDLPADRVVAEHSSRVERRQQRYAAALARDLRRREDGTRDRPAT